MTAYLKDEAGAGDKPTSDLHMLNAASAKRDRTEGDDITIADAASIGQQLADCRPVLRAEGIVESPGQNAAFLFS